MWFKEYNIADFNWMSKGTLFESLGIEFTEIGPDYLKAQMPIDHRTLQPFKVLHGGASVALAESLGSLASQMVIDQEKQFAVGQSINASHVRPGINGFAHGTARALHIGKTSHLWNIEIVNDEGKLLCVCRLTMAVKDLPTT